MDDVKQTIKKYLLEEFLPDEDPDDLTGSTELVTSGVLDSIATLKLVGFLEEKYDIELAAHETDVEHLNTIDLMAELVQSKR